MKKKRVLPLAILSVLIIAIIFIVLFISNLNIYTINEDVCNSIFNQKTPQEFCETKGSYTDLEDYFFAHVDKDGNLLLALTDKQLKNWITSSSNLKAIDIVTGGRTEFFESYDVDMNDSVEKGLFYDFQEGTVIVSDDYKKITIKYGEMHEILSSFFRITNGCIHMQLLNGIPSEDITLQLVVVNQNGEIVTDLTWPKDNLVYERTFIR